MKSCLVKETNVERNKETHHCSSFPLWSVVVGASFYTWVTLSLLAASLIKTLTNPLLSVDGLPWSQLSQLIDYENDRSFMWNSIRMFIYLFFITKHRVILVLVAPWSIRLITWLLTAFLFPPLRRATRHRFLTHNPSEIHLSSTTEMWETISRTTVIK